ncbi:MAG: ribose-phosphate diphosphokinase [Bdellovibrionales bacterium]
MKIFSGTSNPAFSESVSSHLGKPLGQMKVSRFADGETFVEIQENVRGSSVFVIQSTCPPVNENYMELFLILDALKRASASEINLVMPYYGYARQDRKSAPRVPISAKCMADMCSVAGAHRLVVMDLHSAQIQGFFNKPVDNLFAGPSLAEAWLARHKSKKITIVSPDAGGMERARQFAKKIEGADIAMIDKRREGPNKAKAFHLVGKVEGQTTILVDDIIDTAGTLCEASSKLLEYGAKEVFAIVTHPLFSGSACEAIEKSPIKEVLVTNTIPLSEEALKSRKITSINLAPLVAEAIQRIANKNSISTLFK